MGSSAAYSVGLSACLFLSLSNLLSKPFVIKDNLKLIGEHADFLEKIIHGNPSGVDVQIVMNGGFLKFTRGNPIQIERYQIKTNSLFNFILVNTNKQREGKVTIERVRKMKEDDPDKFNDAIGLIGDITEDIIECLGLGQ